MSNPLTTEQQAAVESRERDILVEAGAGSGKTSTTVERYMRLIDGELEPSGILVFTFTEKAATELRERVRDERQAKDASFSMSSAWIGTFHAICASILRLHPIQAGIDPSFQILDDIRSERLKSMAYDAALGEFMSTPEREEMIARFTASFLREGVFNAYEQLRSRGMGRPELPKAEPGNPSRLVEHLLAEAEAALAIEGIRKPLPEKIEALIAFLRSTSSNEVTFDSLSSACFSSKSEKIEDLIGAMRLARAKLAEIEFGDGIRAGLGELLETYGDRYAEAKRRNNLLDFEDLQIQTVELLVSSPSVASIYSTRFKEIMVDEFQDTNQLQLDLIDALRGEETRLFTVGDEMQAIYGFRHADVKLFRARRDDADVQLPLSANFRSQAPVIGAVNHIGRKLDEGESKLRRGSDPASRHQIADLQVGLEPGEYDGEEVEMLFTETKGWAGLDLGPMSRPIDLAEHNLPATTGNCEAEALAVAHHLKATMERTGIRASETAILFKNKANIPVFASALTQVGLDPYVVGGSGFWESREGTEVKSLLATLANPLDDDSLLGALAGPACGLSTDALLLLRQATSRDQPLWPTLLATVDGDLEIELLGAADRRRAEAFVRSMRSLRKHSATTPLGEQVEAVVTMTGYDLANLIRDPGANGLANVRHIASLAADFETTEGRDLRGLLEWIELSTNLDSESAVATQEEDSDVVRLMTIHKAKGLEFDLVCVADLERKGKGVGESVFWIGDEATGSDGELSFGLRIPQPDGENLDLYDWDRLYRNARDERVDENLRLFHVALTRARKRLLISGTFDLEKHRLDLENEDKDYKPITDAAPLIGRVASALDIGPSDPESIEVEAPEGLPALARQPETSRMVIRRNDANEDQAEYLRRTGQSLARSEADDTGQPPLRRPDRPPHPNVPLSFSALNEFRECPSRFYASRILRLRDPGEDGPTTPGTPGLDPETERLNLRNEGTHFGTALHEVFEASAERRWIPPTEREVISRLEANGLDLSDGSAAKRALAMISGFLDSSLADRIRTKRSEVEIPLLVEIQGVVIRGFADLLIRDFEPPLIVDYKTNRLGDLTPREKMKDYGLQRDLYGLAVSQALEVPAVETAFVFLEKPDEPVADLMDRDRLFEGEHRIAALIEEITSGHFFGGPGAPHQPCGDCWACETLGVQRERALAA